MSKTKQLHWYFALGGDGLIFMWDTNKNRGAMVWLNEIEPHLQVPYLVDTREEFLQAIIDCCDQRPGNVVAWLSVYHSALGDTWELFITHIYIPAHTNKLTLPR